MQGSLGIGANLTRWTPDEFSSAKQWIADYKRIRETVQHGSLYRLISPQQDSENAATESVSLDKKQAVLFAFLHSSQNTLAYPTIQMRGLDPDAIYRLEPLHSASSDGPQSASGRYWMAHGIAPKLNGDFKAAAFLFTATAR
jgi:alpha-galactosidase